MLNVLTLDAGREGNRVLFLSGLQIHPTLSGGTLRSFGLVNSLKRNGLDVFVYSLAGRKRDYLARRPSSTQVWPEGILEYVNRGPLGFLAAYASYGLALPPLWITTYLRLAAASRNERLLPALLREKLAWCDIVVADFPFLHPIFTAPSARDRQCVLSTHNIEHHLLDDQRGWRDRWTREAVRSIELAAAKSCDILVTCCTGDQQFFEAYAKRSPLLVPNGIDPRRFRGMEAHRSGTRRALGLGEDVMLVLFTASKWGPNRDAFDFLLGFAKSNEHFLVEQGIHILVVGGVVAEPVRLPALTATGKVEVVEPYFAAADAALNPIETGAGTNVKMYEFLAARLPILTTPFGARGFLIRDGATGFIFEKNGLAATLSLVRRLHDEEPGRLRQVAHDAYADNQKAIDMDTCVLPLVEALSEARHRVRPAAPIHPGVS